MLKINKLQLNRVGRPERGALMPCKDGRAQQKEERFLFFPGKDSAANEKPQTLFSPSNFLFLSINWHAGTCTWPAVVADAELQFSANPK